MKESKSIFCKGIAMGICDLVPGISGGTIALITGIYERLIQGIKNLNIRWVFYLLKFIFTGRTSAWHKTRIHFLKIDWQFFIPLAIGIGLAIFLGVRVISFLIDSYFIFLMSFFIGVILASLFFLQRKVTDKSNIALLYFIFGSAIGVLLAVAIPTQTPDVWWMYIISGFFGIFALFLPGISGSYILLLLGKYAQIIEALKSPFSHIVILLLFAVGAIAGMVLVSRIISYFLQKVHDKTIYTLIGIVLGSLILPMRLILGQLHQTPVSLLSILCILIGLSIPFIIHQIHRKTEQKT